LSRGLPGGRRFFKEEEPRLKPQLAYI